MPVSLAIAAAVKLEDGGPVFYGQERVGRGGEVFTALKFRSMRPRPEGEDENPPGQAEREAERITRVGRVIRRHALDELPQLWNVLRGDMSLVGPRALLPEEVPTDSDGSAVRIEEVAGFEERHQVRPGLTGLAQVRVSRSVSHERKFRHDVEYVRHRTLWLDVKLILRSVWISLRGGWPHIGAPESGEN